MTARERLDLALVALASQGRRPRCSDYNGAQLWLSDDREERALAVGWCQGCELIELCGAAADETGEKFGVWGGRDRTKINTTKIN